MHLSLLKGGVPIRLDYLSGLLTWPVFTGQMLQVHILSNECLEDENLKSGADGSSDDYQTSFSPFHTSLGPPCSLGFRGPHFLLLAL